MRAHLHVVGFFGMNVPNEVQEAVDEQVGEFALLAMAVGCGLRLDARHGKRNVSQALSAVRR